MMMVAVLDVELTHYLLGCRGSRREVRLPQARGSAPPSNIRAVWHLDEFVAVPRLHLFPTDFTVRQRHGFVVRNFICCPAVAAFKSFRHLKNKGRGTLQ
jgi:hypothetical protein